MKLGLISDTHGNIQRTAQAEALLKAEAAEAIIHCGDIGAEGILIHLASAFEPRGVPVYAVLGNVDLFGADLEAFPEEAGVHVLGRFGDLTLAGRRIALVHGDDERKLNEAIRSGAYDYVFKGHSHRREDFRRADTRVINPGALHNTHQPSCAVLDMERDELRFLDVLNFS